eukprot:5765040-Prymnesium_polylepis.1
MLACACEHARTGYGADILFWIRPAKTVFGYGQHHTRPAAHTPSLQPARCTTAAPAKQPTLPCAAYVHGRYALHSPPAPLPTNRPLRARTLHAAASGSATRIRREPPPRTARPASLDPYSTRPPCRAGASFVSAIASAGYCSPAAPTVAPTAVRLCGAAAAATRSSTLAGC